MKRDGSVRTQGRNSDFRLKLVSEQVQPGSPEPFDFHVFTPDETGGLVQTTFKHVPLLLMLSDHHEEIVVPRDAAGSLEILWYVEMHEGLDPDRDNNPSLIGGDVIVELPGDRTIPMHRTSLDPNQTAQLKVGCPPPKAEVDQAMTLWDHDDASAMRDAAEKIVANHREIYLRGNRIIDEILDGRFDLMTDVPRRKILDALGAEIEQPGLAARDSLILLRGEAPYYRGISFYYGVDLDMQQWTKIPFFFGEDPSGQPYLAVLDGTNTALYETSTLLHRAGRLQIDAMTAGGLRDRLPDSRRGSAWPLHALRNPDDDLLRNVILPEDYDPLVADARDCTSAPLETPTGTKLSRVILFNDTLLWIHVTVSPDGRLTIENPVTLAEAIPSEHCQPRRDRSAHPRSRRVRPPSVAWRWQQPRPTQSTVDLRLRRRKRGGEPQRLQQSSLEPLSSAAWPPRCFLWWIIGKIFFEKGRRCDRHEWLIPVRHRGNIRSARMSAKGRSLRRLQGIVRWGPCGTLGDQRGRELSFLPALTGISCMVGAARISVTCSISGHFRIRAAAL